MEILWISYCYPHFWPVPGFWSRGIFILVPHCSPDFLLLDCTLTLPLPFLTLQSGSSWLWPMAPSYHASFKSSWPQFLALSLTSLQPHPLACHSLYSLSYSLVSSSWLLHTINWWWQPSEYLVHTSYWGIGVKKPKYCFFTAGHPSLPISSLTFSTI